MASLVKTGARLAIREGNTADGARSAVEKSRSVVEKSSNSISGLVSTFAPSFALAVAFLILFFTLRRSQKRMYEPRTYLGTLQDHQKTPRPPNTTFGWIPDFMKINDSYVLSHHSMDGYLYLRFFRTLVYICLVGWLLTWAVLLPLYGTSHGNYQQLEKLSYANIDIKIDANRLYTPVFIAWLFLGFVMFVIGQESMHYVQVKQAFLLLPGISSRLSSRTVLFTNVPKPFLNEAILRETFPSIESVWIASDTEKLDDLIEKRDETAMKLEGAEIKLLGKANEKRLKAMKTGEPEKEIEDPMHWLDEKKRPKFRKKFLKLPVGQKVDLIDWCRDQLQEIIPKVREEQTHIKIRESFPTKGEVKYNSAVFIEFHDVKAAQSAFRKTHTKLPEGFEPRTTGTQPLEIIWKNLNMGKVQRKFRSTLATILVVALTIAWTPFTTCVGGLSNVDDLAQTPHLDWISKIPPKFVGVVTGLIPVVILRISLRLVPTVMRLIFSFAGPATAAETELKTQTWYFVFQVIQVFLVTTLASGAAATVRKVIDEPPSATTILATSLPKAANFYIDYFVLFGLVTAAKTLANLKQVAIYMLSKNGDNTPRKMYKRYMTLPSIKWGTHYPKFVNLGVIAISYSCISPLILGFATISFFLVFIAFRYNMIYTLDTVKIDTQGRAFEKALMQLTTGVYLSAGCLISLLSMSTATSPKAAGPLALMVVFLACAIIYHILLNRALASMDKMVTRDADAALTPKSLDFQTSGTGDSAFNRRFTSGAGNKAVARFVKFLRPPAPDFDHRDRHLFSRVPRYPDDVHKEAYLNPAIRSETPVLWIVHDEMGISRREIEASADIIDISDYGAWFDEKSGKIITLWDGEEEVGEWNKVRKAPIYKEPVNY